jgi:hypothetical protein
VGLIGSETGWKLYDPQLKRFIDPGRDAPEIRATLDVGREHLPFPA